MENIQGVANSNMRACYMQGYMYTVERASDNDIDEYWWILEYRKNDNLETKR